jgi:hypothetical protein
MSPTVRFTSMLLVVLQISDLSNICADSSVEIKKKHKHCRNPDVLGDHLTQERQNSLKLVSRKVWSGIRGFGCQI